MLMSGMLHRLLLAGACLCVYGNPVHHPNVTPTQCASSLTAGQPTDINSKPSDGKHVSGPILNGGAEGGAGSNGHISTPEGIALVKQTENGDRLDGKSGPSVAGGDSHHQNGEVKKVESASEMRGSLTHSEADATPESTKENVSVLTPAGETKQLDMADINTRRLTPFGFMASSSAPPQLETYSPSRVTPPVDRDSIQVKNAETSWPSSTEPPNPSERIRRLTSPSPIPPSVVFSPQTSTTLSIWSHEGGTISTLPDPLLPDIGPNLMPREDGMDSLWTEAVRPSGGE